MLFHSIEFNILMIATLACFYLFPRSRVLLLAVANTLFYGASGTRYLLLFVAVAAITYGCSLVAHRPRGKWAMILGVVLNLANLGYFKYTGFVITTLDRLAQLGIDPRPWQLILPVGISFYAFQLIAYLVDVYRGDLKPARNFVEFWVFIAFFGQLIAGPIMRGEDFLPQVEEQGRISFNERQFKKGVFLFVQGMLKKVVFADFLGAKADFFFGQAQNLGMIEAWIAAYLFAFQIYFDFSAYSDMAVGIGHLFGFELTNNFRTPYLAANPGEFWRRWHITLSSWIRDYLYIPLGGSRRGETRAYLNLFVAMALSGLWHGAAWTFVIWGIFHGALSVMHKLYARYLQPRVPLPAQSIWVRWVSIFLMFQATTVAWVFFRANGLTTAVHMLKQMLLFRDIHLTRQNALYLLVVTALYVIHFLENKLQESRSVVYHRWVEKIPSPIRALAYAGIVVFLLLMTRSEEATFIYFRF